MPEESTGPPADMMPNRVKSILSGGGTVFGTWVITVRTPSIVRMIGAAGFDFVFVDTQHSSFSWETVGDMCEMARAAGVVPIVRAYEASAGLTNRLQDLGAVGVMFPDVTSPDQVQRAVGWMMYPPRGGRGHTAAGPAMDHRAASGAPLQRAIDDQALMVIQVESLAGVESVDDILAVGGVDIVEVGRGDLSVSLGVPFETRHERVLDALDTVVAACGRHGVVAGVNCASVDEAQEMMARGVRCISFSTDRSILTRAYNAAAAGLRAAADPRPIPSK